MGLDGTKKGKGKSNVPVSRTIVLERGKGYLKCIRTVSGLSPHPLPNFEIETDLVRYTAHSVLEKRCEIV